MSAVLERVKANRKKLKGSLPEELETKRLSRLLRRETWADHARAEYSPFEIALVRGTIPREAYLDLLTQVHPIYLALEKRAEEFKNDELGGRVYFSSLNRSEAVAADAEFYGGPDWQSKAEVLDVTKEFIKRIEGSTPLQFVAHHYNRYLADLSGGIMISAGIRKAWDLDGDGARYYDFTEIGDADEFKNNYRAILDNLPLTTAQKLELIEEVMLAYEFNIEMVRVLGAKHDVQAPANGGGPAH